MNYTEEKNVQEARNSMLQARVYKRHNSAWYGIGRVLRLMHSNTIAVLLMETGGFIGEVGGFDVTTLTFYKADEPYEPPVLPGQD
jgi:hypothetical protein